MVYEIEYIRSIVKKQIHKKYGFEVTYSKECKILFDSILEKTNRQISISTLKRFFGIVNSRFNPSKYTLDTLAIYLKFKNWDELIFELKENKVISVETDFWEKAGKRFQVVTNKSLISIKAKLGKQYKNFPVREFAIDKISTFLHSQLLATAFIAPNGSGKSTIVAQLTELFFTGENARYPNDIACLIDGSILFNLIDFDLEIGKFENVLDFDHYSSFSVYFRENPDQVKGRFVLIIDSPYEIYYKQEKLIYFIENLLDITSAYKDFSWFKLIISCRPDDWKIVENIIEKTPELKSLWFDVSFVNVLFNTVNVPELNENEISQYLMHTNSPVSFEYLKFHYPEISEIIKNPYFLHLYGLNQKPEDVYSDIGLLTQFVNSKVLTGAYLEEKSKILNSFFRISHNAQFSNSVDKKDLPELSSFNPAYKELISDNVLYEYTVRGNYLAVNTYVKFTNDILLGFFLANKWMEENGFNLNLFRRIYQFYESNKQLQTGILKYLIKFAFKESNTEILKNIFSVFEGENEIPFDREIKQVDPDIINVIGTEIRNNKALRNTLIPHYAKSKHGQYFCFESFFDMDSIVLHSGGNVRFYLENKRTTEAFIYGHFLKFMQFFLAMDNVNCLKEYELFQTIELPDNTNPATAGYYFCPQLMYQSVFFAEVDSDLISRIYKMSELFYNSGVQSAPDNSIFEHMVFYSLNYGDKFAEICSFMNFISNRFDALNASTTWYNQLAKAIYARALLNTGNIQKALQVFNQAELNIVPVNIKNYVKIRFNLVKVEFLIFKAKCAEAKLLIEEIKTISKMLKLKFFYDKALTIESII